MHPVFSRVSGHTWICAFWHILSISMALVVLWHLLPECLIFGEFFRRGPFPLPILISFLILNWFHIGVFLACLHLRALNKPMWLCFLSQLDRFRKTLGVRRTLFSALGRGCFILFVGLLPLSFFLSLGFLLNPEPHRNCRSQCRALGGCCGARITWGSERKLGGSRVNPPSLQCPFLCGSLWNSYSVLSLDGFPGHFLGFIWGFWHSFALFNCVVLISPTYLSFTVGFFLQPDATKSRRSRLRAFGGRLWLGLPSFVLDLCVGPDGWTAHLLHAMAFDSLISLGFCNLWGFDLELIILYSSFSLFWFISFFLFFFSTL